MQRTAPTLLRRIRRAASTPAFVYFVAVAFARGASLILIPLYTRMLTPAEYGEYALGQTLLALLPAILSLGMIATVGRFYFDTKDVAEGRARMGSAARWLVAITLAASALCCALLAFVPKAGTGIGDRYVLGCIVCASTGSALWAIPGTVFRTVQRPFTAAALQLLEFFAIVLPAVWLVRWAGHGLRGCFEAYALGYGALGAGALIFTSRLPGRLARETLPPSLRLSLPFVPHFVANQLQYVADRWALKAAGLEAQLGPYSLAVQLISPISMGVAAWNDAASPKMGEAFRLDGVNGIRVGFRRMQRNYALVAAAGGALICIALPIARLLIGDRYRSALWLVPILCAIVVVESLYFPSVNVLFYASATRLIPPITFISAVINIALNVVFIRAMGVPGAVLARACSMTVRTAAVWLAARHCLAARPMA